MRHEHQQNMEVNDGIKVFSVVFKIYRDDRLRMISFAYDLIQDVTTRCNGRSVENPSFLPFANPVHSTTAKLKSQVCRIHRGCYSKIENAA